MRVLRLHLRTSKRAADRGLGSQLWQYLLLRFAWKTCHVLSTSSTPLIRQGGWAVGDDGSKIPRISAAKVCADLSSREAT